VQDLRRNYTKGALLEGEISDNPFELFSDWFSNALTTKGIIEANAMVLSTVSKMGVDSRIVLLKGVRSEQFVFYTNYDSHKGLQLLNNPNCTLVFPWIAMERQVIVRGIATKVSDQESATYFNSRPKSSQIGAWASAQSKPIDSRESLDHHLKEVELKFQNQPIIKPPHWGGFAVYALEIEFWQGRENRMHDRLCYTLDNKKWSVGRLQP
jgi:pyridoxamine 5'-phosphate oxidase